ncbi:unnamed protein product [Phaeothamnion confervicola]
MVLPDTPPSAIPCVLQDSRMRAMIAKEPLVPFIYRVNALCNELGISSVVAVGGCGEWFDVQDTTILLEDYRCTDATAKAASVSRRFSNGRVQFAGRGLVHRLPWPTPIVPRGVMPTSIGLRSATAAPTGPTTSAAGGATAAGTPAVASPAAPVTGSASDANGGGGGRSGWGGDAIAGSSRLPSAGPAWLRYGGSDVDLSRLEQLAGGAPHAAGCGWALRWMAARGAEMVAAKARMAEGAAQAPTTRDSADPVGLAAAGAAAAGTAAALNGAAAVNGAAAGNGAAAAPAAVWAANGAGPLTAGSPSAPPTLQVLLRELEAALDGPDGLAALGPAVAGGACDVARPRPLEVAAAANRLPGVEFIRLPAGEGRVVIT